MWTFYYKGPFAGSGGVRTDRLSVTAGRNRALTKACSVSHSRCDSWRQAACARPLTTRAPQPPRASQPRDRRAGAVRSSTPPAARPRLLAPPSAAPRLTCSNPASPPPRRHSCGARPRAPPPGGQSGGAQPHTGWARPAAGGRAGAEPRGTPGPSARGQRTGECLAAGRPRSAERSGRRGACSSSRRGGLTAAIRAGVVLKVPRRRGGSGRAGLGSARLGSARLLQGRRALRFVWGVRSGGEAGPGQVAVRGRLCQRGGRRALARILDLAAAAPGPELPAGSASRAGFVVRSETRRLREPSGCARCRPVLPYLRIPKGSVLLRCVSRSARWALPLAEVRGQERVPGPRPSPWAAPGSGRASWARSFYSHEAETAGKIRTVGCMKAAGRKHCWVVFWAFWSSTLPKKAPPLCNFICNGM